MVRGSRVKYTLVVVVGGEKQEMHATRGENQQMERRVPTLTDLSEEQRAEASRRYARGEGLCRRRGVASGAVASIGSAACDLRTMDQAKRMGKATSR